MKNKYLKIILICLGVLALAYVIYLGSKQKDVKFNAVELSEDHQIINQTSRNYLDTIISVGLSEMGISGFKVYVMNLGEEFKNNPAKGTGDMNLKATVFNYGSDFIMYVDESVDKGLAIEVITHELIHLGQFWSGDLKVINKSGTVIWKGQIIEALSVDYESRPWEIEAFDKGRKLSSDVSDILIVKD